MGSLARHWSFFRLASFGLIVSAIGLGRVHGQDAEGLVASEPQTASGKLVVHEWGTFTSFSGSNGVQLDFRPLINEDVPSFVFDRRMQTGLPNLSKGSLRARIRMETPVTYFYTDVERTVSARVEFPEGLLTEFYPPVVTMTPVYGKETSDGKRVGQSSLDWGGIHLIPISKLAPSVQNQQTKDWLSGLIQSRILPHDGNPANHYYRARETDSAFVHFRRSGKTTNPYLAQTDYIEKFLFYRGVGRFDQPLQVSMPANGRVIATNSGNLPIRSVFCVTVSGGKIAYSELPGVEAGKAVEFPADPKVISIELLMNRMTEALVRERLYPKEATAMVHTWQDSWFAEEGTRVFYMVPGELTGKILPLTISPAPDESVRVLVGRVEVMPQSTEKQLMEVVRTSAAERKKLKDAVAKGLAKSANLGIPEGLKKMGRFAEPALVRVRELARDNIVSQEAEVLIQQCRKAMEKDNKTISSTSD